MCILPVIIFSHINISSHKFYCTMSRVDFLVIYRYYLDRYISDCILDGSTTSFMSIPNKIIAINFDTCYRVFFIILVCLISILSILVSSLAKTRMFSVGYNIRGSSQYFATGVPG